MNGEDDKTEEIMNIMLHLGIDKGILRRISGLMILQLYASHMSGRENPFIIVDEIFCLNSCAE